MLPASLPQLPGSMYPKPWDFWGAARSCHKTVDAWKKWRVGIWCWGVANVRGVETNVSPQIVSDLPFSSMHLKKKYNKEPNCNHILSELVHSWLQKQDIVPYHKCLELHSTRLSPTVSDCLSRCPMPGAKGIDSGHKSGRSSGCRGLQSRAAGCGSCTKVQDCSRSGSRGYTREPIKEAHWKEKGCTSREHQIEVL